MPKDPKKLLRIMTILCIVIALVAFAVAIVAAAMEEYIITLAMLIVTGWQFFNYGKWKQSL